MTIISKKQMSEEDIKLQFITPAITVNGLKKITMETKITGWKNKSYGILILEKSLNVQIMCCI